MPDKKYIKGLAKKTLRIESDAISKLSEQIDDNFYNCVKLLHSCTGRIVVTGIGKSALIGQKIVATFNSTGTASYFLHAADAVHGDIGLIGTEDIVLVLSKSGETAELKALVPIVKNLGNTVIGICSNSESFLCNKADYSIHVPVDMEADPNNLAPTASSMAQMAMGDVLAISLLSMKGFTPEQFAKFHPGGSLGKQMYMKVKDLSSNNEKPAVLLSDSLKKAIVEITEKRLGAVVILGSENNIIGIITDGDLRRALEKYEDITNVALADIMSKNPLTIEEDEMALNALELMRQNSITQLIVQRNGIYSGIIHIHDILREGII